MPYTVSHNHALLANKILAALYSVSQLHLCVLPVMCHALMQQLSLVGLWVQLTVRLHHHPVLHNIYGTVCPSSQRSMFFHLHQVVPPTPNFSVLSAFCLIYFQYFLFLRSNTPARHKTDL